MDIDLEAKVERLEAELEKLRQSYFESVRTLTLMDFASLSIALATITGDSEGSTTSLNEFDRLRKKLLEDVYGA